MTTTATRQPRTETLAAMLATIRTMPAVPLQETVRGDIEARTGTDLSNVRVHVTPEAAHYAEALGARAFTFGRDIVIGEQANASTFTHEAMHAAQFSRHGAPTSPTGIASSDHPAHIEASSLHSDGQGQGTQGVAPTSPGGMIQCQEAPEKEKAGQSTLVGDFFRSALKTDTGKAAAALLPADVQLAAQLVATSNAFSEAFVRTVITSLTQADADALIKQFKEPTANVAFDAGLRGGVVYGVGEDIVSNLEGLYEIAKLVIEYSPIGMTARAMAEAAEYAYDPDLFLQIKRQEGQHAKDVIAAVLAFAKQVASDPTFLVGQGEKMGAACGEMTDEWFHGDFMQQSPIKKGFTVGRGLGIAATEIAMLFLGPEEWVVRGAVATGSIAKGSWLYKAIAEVLEKIPEMARLFKAKTELENAQRGLKSVKKIERLGEGAEEVGKGKKALAAAGDAPKDVPLPKAPETHVPEPKKVEPRKVEPTKAEPPAAKKPAKAEPPAAKKLVEPEPRKPADPKPVEPPKTKQPVTQNQPATTSAEPIKSVETNGTPPPRKGRVEAQQDVLVGRESSKEAADLKVTTKATEVELAQAGVPAATQRVDAARGAALKAKAEAEAATTAASLAKPGSKRAANASARTARETERRAEIALRDAEGALKRAQKDVEVADKSLVRAKQTAANREVARKTSKNQLERVEQAVANPTEAPRLKRGELFDPKKRRPNFEEFPDVAGRKVDRHSGLRTDPDAHVGVFREEVPTELRLEHDELAKILTDPNSGQKERAAAGHRYEQLLQRDLAKGDAPRIRASAGDKDRIGDVGIHEVTVEQVISDGKLDQLWRDLIERDVAILTVPKLDPASEKRLSKMAEIFEKLTGRRPMITVRETL